MRTIRSLAIGVSCGMASVLLLAAFGSLDFAAEPPCNSLYQGSLQYCVTGQVGCDVNVKPCAGKTGLYKLAFGYTKCNSGGQKWDYCVLENVFCAEKWYCKDPPSGNTCYWGDRVKDDQGKGVDVYYDQAKTKPCTVSS